jgi:hypothetical protein
MSALTTITEEMTSVLVKGANWALDNGAVDPKRRAYARLYYAWCAFVRDNQRHPKPVEYARIINRLGLEIVSYYRTSDEWKSDTKLLRSYLFNLPSPVPLRYRHDIGWSPEVGGDPPAWSTSWCLESYYEKSKAFRDAIKVAKG